MTRSSSHSRGARLGRRLAVITASTAAATVVGLGAFGGVSEAHTPDVVSSCKNLKVTLDSYEGKSPNNHVTVTIDDVDYEFDFGAKWTKTFKWSQKQNHRWSVDVDANRSQGDPDQFDWAADGMQLACKEGSTSTDDSTTTTEAPTTTVEESTTTTEAPTTTTEAPTTTVDESTTTVEESTTTTDESTTTTEAPTTTVDESTTTQAPSTDASTSTDVTVVAVEAQSGVAPSTDYTYYNYDQATGYQQTGTVTGSSGGSLPVTGANSTMGAAAALAAIGAGTALVVVARRRRVPEA